MREGDINCHIFRLSPTKYRVGPVVFALYARPGLGYSILDENCTVDVKGTVLYVVRTDIERAQLEPTS